MIAIPIKKVNAKISGYISEIDDFTLQAKTSLANIRRKSLTPEESKYLDTLIPYFDKKELLVTAQPDELNRIKGVIGKVPKRHKKKGQRGRPPKSLKDKIIGCLNYEGLRRSFFPRFFKDIDIKTCVYCNSQLTVAAERTRYTVSKVRLKKSKKVTTKAKFQLDHFLPQSEYPGFSISLFNLYPVCGPCNNTKKITHVNFQLYSSLSVDKIISNYSFELDTASIAKYKTTKDHNDIVILFHDPEKPDKNITVKGSLTDTFDINGIYNTQKDIVEELYWISEVYTGSYKQDLLDSFSKLFTNSSLSNRILIGNYVEPENIHKRPMAKFTQDIARQLGLIK